MSYPTPWTVDYDGDVIDADGDIVIEGRAANWDLRIQLDDLVSRINAGAEAEARAERAEKALEQACSSPYWIRAPLTTEDVDENVHPNLYAYLKEKEKK